MSMLIAEELEVDLSQVRSSTTHPNDKLYANALALFHIGTWCENMNEEHGYRPKEATDERKRAALLRPVRESRAHSFPTTSSAASPQTFRVS
jgi:hypothetical protein